MDGKVKAKRKSISKKTRFEVFKRDGFRCVYCGATPLAELLHVDHVIAVADGGESDMDNYCTSCAPCNLGKGARALADVPQSLADKAKNIAEQEAQIAAYQHILSAKRDRVDSDTWAVVAVFTPGASTCERADFQSIRRFIERLGRYEVIDAMEVAKAKGFYSNSATFRYFCGVCWGRIRDLENNTVSGF